MKTKIAAAVLFLTAALGVGCASAPSQAAPAASQPAVNAAAAAYLDAGRPLVEKWRVKFQQISATYATPEMKGPAVAAKLAQDLGELKAISGEVRALTPPACLDRAHRSYLGATNVAEIAVGTLGDGLRHNDPRFFEVAALQLQDTARMMQKATAEMERADC